MQATHASIPGSSGCFKRFAVCVVMAGIVICFWTYLTGWNSLFHWSLSLPRPAFPQALAHPAHPSDASATDRVTGGPRLTPDFLNQVLAAAHSPAAGTGQALYDLSTRYQIDDGYALAFFEHESSFGTAGMARVTLSLGNIRCSRGYQCINGYRAYGRWSEGYADWYALIRQGYIAHGLETIEQIIPVYAPASDGNDVAAYIRDVQQAVARWHAGEV